MRTRAQLINQILKRLGALPVGQDANPEDYSRVNDVLASLSALMQGEDVYTIADLDSIDEEAFLPIAAWMALEIAPDFQIGGDDLTELAALAKQAKERLRYMDRMARSDAPARTEYF